MTLKVVRSTIPACAPASSHAASYSRTISFRAMTTTNSVAPSGRFEARDEADLRVLDPKRRRLRTCHVINSSRSRGRAGTFSNRRRETFATLSGTASATRFGRAPRRSNTCRSARTPLAIDDVGRVQRGDDCAWRQRLHGMGRDRERAPRDATCRRHPVPRDLDRDGGQRRREK
jgi:hypothetical protein